MSGGELVAIYACLAAVFGLLGGWGGRYLAQLSVRRELRTVADAIDPALPAKLASLDVLCRGLDSKVQGCTDRLAALQGKVTASSVAARKVDPDDLAFITAHVLGRLREEAGPRSVPRQVPG